MSFTDAQKIALAAPLSANTVKKRDQGGRKVSYVEGWHVIAEANRIFGFDGWSRETIELKCVSEKDREIGQQKTPGFGVTYIARVRVRVGDLVREGCGSGHGIDRDLGQAHESALKEAETDAMKRALMTFGNPFGLALYDKDQTNVASEDDMAKALFIAGCRRMIADENDPAKLREWWQSETQKEQRREHDLNKEEVKELKDAVLAKLSPASSKKAA